MCADIAWRDPVEVLAGFAEEPYAFALLSGARGWSYVGRAPAEVLTLRVGGDAARVLRSLLRPPARKWEGPPFQGGVIGLASYELGAVVEPSTRQARTGWPDLAAARYDAVLAFDMDRRRVFAVGAAADKARGWIETASAPLRRPPSPLADAFDDLTRAEPYAAAVAEVVAAIAQGDLFQANIARRWSGRLAPGATPFHALRRLAVNSAAPFAAYLRLPGRAVVSNSPERFLHVAADGRVRAQPIKGTRPRGASPEADAALAGALLASAKDRAENRMIVDLMRNDLSRVCIPGSVEVESLFALERYANVQHLVSTVRGQLARSRDAFDLFASAFPPGSVTGAPKVQAMLEIARREPPRGPYCGSLFWAGDDGAFDSSVLIRTLALEEEPGGGWRFETRAGAGIVADSDARAEAQEADDKIVAIRQALTA